MEGLKGTSLPWIEFGTVEEVRLRRNCPLCQLVLSLVPPIPNYVTGSIPYEGKTYSPMIKGTLNDSPSPWLQDPHELEIRIEGKYLGSITARDLRLGYEAEPTLSDVNLAVHNCRQHHKEDIDIAIVSISVSSIRLIDVYDNNITGGTLYDEYFTLSYVWGGTSSLQATMENIDLLQQPNALTNLQTLLPQVIRDAMEVTRQLGARYLWVDSLCIEQDNLDHKAEQIGLMDKIYLASRLTLVALTGESGESSLPGVRPGTACNPRASATIDEKRLFLRPPCLFEFFDSTTYETRGWTLQERCLSPRLLMFTHHAWYYHCHGTMISNGDWWQQKGHAEYRDLFGTLNLLRDSDLGHRKRFPPDSRVSEYYRYEELVQIYTSRRLSYQSDALNAVSALLASMSRKMASAFLCGLPEQFLELALLWTPSSRTSDPLKRNVSADGAALFPSWTWLGWIGQIQYANGPSSVCFPLRSEGQEAIHLHADVYDYELATGSDVRERRRLLTNGWYSTWRREYSPGPNTVDHFPWTHLIFTAWTASASFFSLSPPNYAASGLRDDPRDWNPMRILDGLGQHCGCLYEYTGAGFDIGLNLDECRFLRLSTSSTSCLKLGLPHETTYPTRSVPPFTSLSSDGEQSAAESEDDDGLDGWSDSDAGSYNEDMDQSMWETTDHDCPIKHYMFDFSVFRPVQECFLNVMLVSWDEGRAERIGVGIIHRKAWDVACNLPEKVCLY